MLDRMVGSIQPRLFTVSLTVPNCAIALKVQGHCGQSRSVLFFDFEIIHICLMDLSFS